MRALNRDQTARRNRERGERRVISSTQDGTAFFDLADFFCSFSHHRSLQKKKKKKKKKEMGKQRK